MKMNKKAMAAVMDAFIFMTVIGLIAAGMFVLSGTDDGKRTKAKEYYDCFFAIELRTNDVFDVLDTQCVMMCDLVAAYMVTDEGLVKDYAERTLSEIIPPIYSYRLVIEYDNVTLIIGDGNGTPISQYSSNMEIISGKTMFASLSLY